MKKTAIVLYLLYSIALILALTFGGGVSQFLIDWFSTTLNAADITDVVSSIDTDTELVAGKSYKIEYTVHGDFRKIPALSFESLDPEHLTVESNGAVCASLDFDGDVLVAGVRITSAQDPDFEKVISYRFVKKYPESFKVTYYLSGHSQNPGKIYVGVPVYVFSELSAASYSVSKYTVVYDEDYFTETDDGALIPIKPTADGEQLTFSITYGNGLYIDSAEFEIVEPECAPAPVDEIRINGVCADEYSAKTAQMLTVTLFNGGKAVASDYTVGFEDEGDVKMNSARSFSFKSAGDKTVTITLPGGYSKTVVIKVRNTVKAPILNDEAVKESRLIKIKLNEVKSYTFSFDSDVTYKNVSYEYDSSIIYITAGSSSFKITPKKAGATEVKMIVDDGVTRVTDSFTVEVDDDRALATLISNNVKVFVSKVLGHITMFVILAFFAMNMFKHCEIESSALRFPLYLLTGLPVAAISEYIQSFMPTRHARVRDVLIDMAGFLIGTLIVLLVRPIINFFKSE